LDMDHVIASSQEALAEVDPYLEPPVIDEAVEHMLLAKSEPAEQKSDDRLVGKVWTYQEATDYWASVEKTRPKPLLEKPKHWPSNVRVDPSKWVYWLPENWGQGIKTTSSGKDLKCWVAPGSQLYYHKVDIEKRLGRTLETRVPTKHQDDDEDKDKDTSGKLDDIDVCPRFPDWLPQEWCVAYRRLAGGTRYRIYIAPGTDRFLWNRGEVEKWLSGAKLTGTPLNGYIRGDAARRAVVEGKRKNYEEREGDKKVTPKKKRRSDEDGGEDDEEAVSSTKLTRHIAKVSVAQMLFTPKPNQGAASKIVSEMPAKRLPTDSVAVDADAGVPKKLSVGDFYAFLQCQLRMEARTLMERDFILKDPDASSMWPTYETFGLRNQGKNEKWIPYHTVLGKHELFVVKEIHHAQVDNWSAYRRFVSMFIFRVHCKMEVFQLQRPYLLREEFWADPIAAFNQGLPMCEELLAYRSQGNALQTSCFLMIPDRLVEDEDLNLVLNILIRTQKLIMLAGALWPVVNDKATSPSQKYRTIIEKVQGVSGFGDTWAKMLMVCIDIAFPHLGLLKDRCEVGIGAMGPLRQILEGEGLLAPKVKREVGPRREQTDHAVLQTNLKGGLIAIRKKGKQLLQVTGSMAGSLDRAHAVASKLCELANQGIDVEALTAHKRDLLSDGSLPVPDLGLAEQAEQLLKAEALKPVHEQIPGEAKTPGEALGQLLARVNSSRSPSAIHFLLMLNEVEAHARSYFAHLPLVVAQMNTQERAMTAATLQVQLCEWRQYQAYMGRQAEKTGKPVGTSSTRASLATTNEVVMIEESGDEAVEERAEDTCILRLD